MQWLIEILIIIFYPVLAILRFFLPLKKLNPNPSQKIPIVIVERWISQNPLHIFLKWYLEKNGFRVYLVNFTVLKNDFATSAFNLSRFLEINQLDKVILVGISLGALTCLEFLQRQEGWDKVKKFIAVGAPFHGTSFSLVFYPYQSGRESLPNSKYMKSWDNEKLLNLGHIYSLYARQDELVKRESSILNGAKNQMIKVSGHNNLHVWCMETFATIGNLAKS